jgi:hypothetical protein
MADPHIVTTLRAKRHELESAIVYLEGKLDEARRDLSHVNAVIRLYEIGPDPQLQFPAHASLNRLFRHGEMFAMCKEALAASGEPLTTRELAMAVIRAKGWDQEDKVLRSAIAYRLIQALNMQAGLHPVWTGQGA